MTLRLYEFEADWCGPCKQQAPIVEELDEEYDELDVQVVDVEDDDETAREYNVRSLPTLILVEDDGSEETVHEQFSGLTDKERLAVAVEEYQ